MRIVNSFSKKYFTKTSNKKAISTIASYCYDTCNDSCVKKCLKKSNPIDIPNKQNIDKSKIDDFELFTQEELDLLENPDLVESNDTLKTKQTKKYENQEHWRRWCP